MAAAGGGGGREEAAMYGRIEESARESERE